MNLLYLEEVDSTNKYAKEHLSELKDRTLIYSSKQTSGRGRLERKWSYIGEENIYASLVLKPDKTMKEVYSNLTQYLCVILCETFEEYRVVPKIKWPNDIQINGRKISGILAEGVVKNGLLSGLVLGFGVNLNCSKSMLDKISQPATALNIELGKNISKEEFLKKLLDKFCLRYDRFVEDGFLLIREDYIRRAGFLNKHLTVKVFDKEISGLAIDVNDSGALVLLDSKNNKHVLFIGDIL